MIEKIRRACVTLHNFYTLSALCLAVLLLMLPEESWKMGRRRSGGGWMRPIRRFFATRHNFYTLSALCLAVLLLALPEEGREEEWQIEEMPAPLLLEEELAPETLVSEWRESRVPRRSTFESIMRGYGLDRAAVAETVEASRGVYDLRRLRAGAAQRAGLDEEGALVEWHYKVDPERTLRLRWGDTIEAALEVEPFEWAVQAFSGIIERSLYDALAHIHRGLAARVAQVFQWEVDFYYDLRPGDTFQILYEAARPPANAFGVPMAPILGRVLAARLTLSGKTHEALFFRAEAGAGYYDGEGRSLRRQFLKMPVSYGRLSSGFSHRRFHPILKKHRPHYGVDYAAPRGTPVHATADGTVVARTRKRAEGNYVHLRHANRYETFYLHLSRFARGIRPGVRVKQGQTIGTVGTTGLSTGPHAHYGMKQNGKWLNPRRIRRPRRRASPSAPSSARSTLSSKSWPRKRSVRILARPLGKGEAVCGPAALVV
jgi:murein DD-endopeptidase MepM/ murein hydrolase activator NlpD